MTIAELIEKLSTLPPRTVVATDAEYGYGYDPSVYLLRAHVDRRDDGTPSWIRDDDGRNSIEPVALITSYGHDEEQL
ncbi:hypothetical protein [Gordonia rubripertincta]|uniref:hypothetical protein n=1 Tax=Gordonia rubripertincta TaxID=36822 RepID=UPI0015FC09D9|nr:hypothetical protein [Gordonia rubripertincta]QMU19019.1 hypothetical protein H3V45_12955 [Gordonia rubripertincta]